MGWPGSNTEPAAIAVNSTGLRQLRFGRQGLHRCRDTLEGQPGVVLHATLKASLAVLPIPPHTHAYFLTSAGNFLRLKFAMQPDGLHLP